MLRQPSLNSFVAPKEELEDFNYCMSDNMENVSRTPRSAINDIMMIPESPRDTRLNRGPTTPFAVNRIETPRNSAFAFPSQYNRPQLRREMTMNFESLAKESTQESPRQRDQATKTTSATSSRYKTQGTSHSGSVEGDDDGEDEAHTQLTDLPAIQQKMVLLLEKMLSHKIVCESDITDFAKADFEILRSIVHRKYKVTLTLQDLKKPPSIVQLLNKVDELQTESKRSEENNKLVFKRALKYLILHYRKEHPKEVKNLRKREYEALICREYFGGIPLPETKKANGGQTNEESEVSKSHLSKRKSSGKKSENVIKQEEKVRGFVINPNTINAKYINFVFGSEQFKSFFYQFIDKNFLNDYGSARKNKLVKIVSHVYGKNSDEGLDNTMEYVEHNAKFKIPWSDHELRVGVKSTCEFIARVEKKKEKLKLAKIRK
jgi:hypothetical protein